MAAIATLSSNAFAADTLADTFKNGTLTGEIRTYYFDKDVANDTQGHETIFASGVMLSYVTDSFKGFKAGVTFQSSATPFSDDASKQLYKSDMWAQGAQLSESYLAYTLGKTDAKIGRMYLSTPLIAGSGSRLIKEAFEGVHITNKDIANTTLGAVYIDKFQARTNRTGKIGEFVAYGDCMYSLYAINKSLEGLTLTLAWAQNKERNEVPRSGITKATDLDIYHIEAIYANKIGAFGYNISGQYWLNEYSSVNAGQDDSIYGYALKAGASYADISGYLAYSQISNDQNIPGTYGYRYMSHGAGNGSDVIYTNALISSYNYDPHMKAYALGLDYKITPSTSVGTIYAYTDTNTDVARSIDNEKVSYTGFYASYAFSGTLKGLTVVTQYEDLGKDKEGGHEFRFKGSYKF